MVSRRSRERKGEIKRKRRDRVKKILEDFYDDMVMVDRLEKEIEEKRSFLDSIKSGMGGSDPVKGGGSSQEDKICKVLDDIEDIKKDIGEYKEGIGKVKRCIKDLGDPDLMSIVYRVWVYGSDSIESLAEMFGISRQAVWKKSDVALFSLYKKFYVD